MIGWASVETNVRSLMPPEAARGLICAQRLFAQMLEGPAGIGARRYLHEREVTDALVATYGLGVGAGGYKGILEGWGVSEHTQHELGLLDDYGRETMVDRVTFPWLSIGGRHIIGLGGRSIRTDERRPKYDNSPERPWFAKGRAVLGLAQSAQAIHGSYALVVEGPFDAWRLVGWGWTNSCATVGAKITLDQLGLVARLTNRIVVMLDDDEGGRRGREALQKLVTQQWLPPALEIHTAVLKGAKDASSPECQPSMVQRALRGALPVHR